MLPMINSIGKVGIYLLKDIGYNDRKVVSTDAYTTSLHYFGKKLRKVIGIMIYILKKCFNVEI
jgi:hypothetical protein